MADLTQPITSIATLGDLKEFIIEVFHEQNGLRGKQTGLQGEALERLLDEMWNHMMVLPPGVKSNLELLREDRDR